MSYGAYIFDQADEFIRWAEAQRRPLTWQRIVDRFDVSRATAYRWLGWWNERQMKRGAD